MVFILGTSKLNQAEEYIYLQVMSLNINAENNAELTFEKRLARDNLWSLDYSKKVVDEYKKFIFLCAITDVMLTPSHAVDQAWHLHLTYSKSYWNDLCDGILKKKIHHSPTLGGDNEQNKFSLQYTNTLKVYEDKLGYKPPNDIWLSLEKRFEDNYISVKSIDYSKAINSVFFSPIPILLIGLVMFCTIVIIAWKFNKNPYIIIMVNTGILISIFVWIYI